MNIIVNYQGPGAPNFRPWNVLTAEQVKMIEEDERRMASRNQGS